MLISARGQRQLTSSAILALGLIGLKLTAIALSLAERLTAGARTGESELITSLGLSRMQAARVAVLEAGGLAVLAFALAVPASSLLFAGQTHLSPLAGAGLQSSVIMTGSQMLSVAAGVVTLAAMHILPASRMIVRVQYRRESVARSGLDLLLLALAVVGWSVRSSDRELSVTISRGPARSVRGYLRALSASRAPQWLGFASLRSLDLKSC